jgi:hypothetical protein
MLAATAAACGGDDDDGAPAADASTTPDADTSGTFSFSWALSDGAAALSCEDVKAITVSLTVTPVDGLVGENDAFGCSAGSAETRGFAPGRYDVEIGIRSTEGPLAEPVTMQDVELAALENKDLGEVQFEIDPVGSFSFGINSGAAGGNCAAVDPDEGAEIVAVKLELKDGAGACVPVVYDIGGTPYDATACDGAAHPACIESDVVITVTDVRSGPYTLSVTGLREGDLPCYRSDPQFSVPGANLTTDIGVVSVPLDETVKECAPAK